MYFAFGQKRYLSHCLQQRNGQTLYHIIQNMNIGTIVAYALLPCDRVMCVTV